MPCELFGDSESPSFDRSALLVDLAENVMVPGVLQLEGAAARLSERVDLLCEAPDAARLESAQDAWRAARNGLRRNESFAFGPLVDRAADGSTLLQHLDAWPSDTAMVDSHISGTAELMLDSTAYDQKGISTLEYLLFKSPGADTATILADYLPITDGTAQRLCAYLSLVADDFELKAQELAGAWDPARGNYVQEVTTAGNGSEAFTTLHAATSEVVNTLIMSINRLREVRIGRPGGKGGGTPDASQVAARFSATSKEGLDRTLQGIRNIVSGDYSDQVGIGLIDYIEDRRSSLVAEVNSALDSAESAIDAIPDSLQNAVVNDIDKVDAAYDEVKDLYRLIGIDVSAALAVTVEFTDNDND